ncbi:F-box domain [Arabidopsis thaliana x Arabidopsis arenosa]|uniref:F-box domain n=1 Tax=Arabidopsis thaliana x Arabidopsis arenosa TaxID=1240361 RepID=A0A8T1Z1A6_9BRAS|nr:F-box domain [Arabidopsis thaliana x Arabidopsis arenosa]
MKKEKKKTKVRDRDLPEEIVINILTRLPLQSIVRFKLVCREWKSLTESAFFGDLYQRSFNSNWSILHGNYRWEDSCLGELKLGLPHDGDGTQSYHLSFSSVLTQSKNKIKEIRLVSCADGLVFLRLKEEAGDMMIRYYVGNPVLAQWTQLPPRIGTDHYTDSGLVTRMHNGALLGYKVVRMNSKARNNLPGLFSREWRFEVFSSNTGKWSVEQVSCPGRGVCMLNTSNPVSLNGKLHWLDYSRRIIVYDFFSCGDHVRALPLPARMQGSEWHPSKRRCHFDSCPSPCGKIICTTSQGYFVLIDVGLIDKVESYNVRVWRLNCDFWNWEKAWEINMASLDLGSKCFWYAIRQGSGLDHSYRLSRNWLRPSICSISSGF